MKFSCLFILSALASAVVATSTAAPYRNLTLIEEIGAGATPSPADEYEYRGTVGTQNILGETARIATGTNTWFGYKLGNNLQLDRPYVIEVVYPEDTQRAYLMALMDCGGSQPGSHFAFHTGVYEAETYVPPTDGNHEPRNITAYPLREEYKSYWMIAWPQRNYWWDKSKFTEFQTSELRNPDGTTRPGTQHGTFDTGLWLYFINKANDPNNDGVAVKTIRIYSVRSIDDLVDPVVDQLRVTSPRRTFWTLESPGRNTGDTHAARARIAGANTLVPVFMDWNFNFPRQLLAVVALSHGLSQPDEDRQGGAGARIGHHSQTRVWRKQQPAPGRKRLRHRKAILRLDGSRHQPGPEIPIPRSDGRAPDRRALAGGPNRVERRD